ncbi:MAG TPA: hypothetical protein VIW93_10040 [Candidatus Acidoferrum sp.]
MTKKPPKTGMAQESTAIEQAIARALRDNLERIQRASDELHHAVNDVVAACGSNKPTNSLPPLLRAQTSAAALAASLEVLSRFITVSMHSGRRSPLEEQIVNLVGRAAPEPPAAPQRPLPAQPVPVASHAKAEPVEVEGEPEETELELAPEPAPLPPMEPTAASLASEPELEGDFNVSRLSTEEQELHRRANRVAKVSMQDIKMLRPEQVRLGREKKDLCIRLKDDIEKAHREYDRRFKPIMDHPVDYFYRWMVEILADGDAHALGDYPYATPARHH